MASFWKRMFGRKPEPAPTAPPPGPEPQLLGSEDETFLAQLVADLANGKRRDELGGKDVLAKIDAVWASGHERLAIEWMEKLLSVPEVPHASTAPLRALLVERYEQRGELDAAAPHLEGLTGEEPYSLRAHYLLAEHARRRGDNERAAPRGRPRARCRLPDARSRRVLRATADARHRRQRRRATSPACRRAPAISSCASSDAARRA
jgi:hypothetical protein